MNNDTRNKYLTPELKSHYMNDFINNVLTCDADFWTLDQDVKDSLIAINQNPNVQTLYSMKSVWIPGKSDAKNESYLKFAYSQNVEMELFKVFLPQITMMYCFNDLSGNDSRCYYKFDYPHINMNFKAEKDRICNMGCLSNKDYFQINHIELTLKSHSKEKHDKFWNDVQNGLLNLI